MIHVIIYKFVMTSMTVIWHFQMPLKSHLTCVKDD